MDTKMEALIQQAVVELQTIHDCWWDKRPSDRLEMIKAIRRLQALLIFMQEDVAQD